MSSKKTTSFFKRASVTDSRLPVPETPVETLANKLVEDATDRASTSGKRKRGHTDSHWSNVDSMERNFFTNFIIIINFKTKQTTSLKDNNFPSIFG
jgi:hypothetical protein